MPSYPISADGEELSLGIDLIGVDEIMRSVVFISRYPTTEDGKYHGNFTLNKSYGTIVRGFDVNCEAFIMLKMKHD